MSDGRAVWPDADIGRRGGFRVCADGQPVNIEPGRVSDGSRVAPIAVREWLAKSKGRGIVYNKRVDRE